MQSAASRFGRQSLVALLAVGMVAGVACGKTNTSGTGRSTALNSIKAVPAGTKLSVETTTIQIADFVRNVGGDRITVVELLAAAQDPHDFEPRPEDIQRLNTSNIVFKNGAGLESHFGRFLDNLPAGTPVVDTSQGVTLRKEGTSVDPHIWHDPQNAKQMVINIREALMKRDPANAAVYQQNAAAYLAQLDQLDASIRAQFASVPTGQRKLVSNHDAFGYFVARYGITFVGSVIPSLDASSEPSAKDTEALLKKIRDQHVCAIFTESSINPKVEQQLAADAGVKVYSNLYGDSMGAPGSDGDTYLKMEASNTTNMVAGMMC